MNWCDFGAFGHLDMFLGKNRIPRRCKKPGFYPGTKALTGGTLFVARRGAPKIYSFVVSVKLVVREVSWN